MNKDGKLSVEELVARATQRFDKADTNRDGVISAEEMTESIRRQRDEKRANRMLKRLDTNGDGKYDKHTVFADNLLLFFITVIQITHFALQHSRRSIFRFDPVSYQQTNTRAKTFV